MNKFTISKVSAHTFHKHVSRVMAQSDRVSAMLSHYTLKELRALERDGGKFFIALNGQVGGGIKPDGEGFNLYNISGVSGLGWVMQQFRVTQGMTHFDCFEPLNTLYEHYGFVEYKREKNWIEGQPDVVYMKHWKA